MLRMIVQQSKTFHTSNITTRRRSTSRRNMVYGNKKFLLCCAAATFSTLPGGQAFLMARPPVRVTPASTTTTPPPPQLQQQQQQQLMERITVSARPCHIPSSPSRPFSSTTIRRFSSRNNNNNNNNNSDGGVLDKIKNAATSVAKSILPTSWFQTEKEKQQAMERQRVKDEVKGGLTELLKDAPLPVRMMGKMMGPLVSSAMSTMAESMAEQQKSIEETLSQATMYLQSDEAVTRLLGPDPQVGAPFSQSSSTTSINGQTKTRLQIGFPVSGSRSSGMAQLSATEAGIERIVLQVDGRQINVSLASSSSSRRKSFSGGSSKNDDDNIIEAEIIEKDTRR